MLDSSEEPGAIGVTSAREASTSCECGRDKRRARHAHSELMNLSRTQASGAHATPCCYGSVISSHSGNELPAFPGMKSHAAPALNNDSAAEISITRRKPETKDASTACLSAVTVASA